MPDKICMESNNYAFHIDIQTISWQGTSNIERTAVSVFGIEVDIDFFTVYILLNKLHKICELEVAKLNKQNLTMPEAKTLTGFLSFFAKTVCLGQIFMQLVRDFVAQFRFYYLGFS